MPLKLNGGVVRQLGLPASSSIAVSCQLELPERLCDDRDALRRHVRAAYLAFDRAIRDERDRHRGASAGPARDDHGTGAGTDGRRGCRPEGRTPATVAQRRAIHAIARRKGIDLAGWLAGFPGVPTATELSVGDAGRLIVALQAADRRAAR